MKTGVYYILALLLFLLAIIGSLQLRVYGDNTLILGLLVASTAYAVFVFLTAPKGSSVYCIALFAISISILFAFSLRTNYVLGNDINWELYQFKLVFDSGHWNPTINLYSSCLSITIFPSILSSITGIDGQVIFKFMYPFLLSFIPVVAFTLYRKWIGENLSFAVSMFLIASTIYLLQMPTLTRQVVAMLLFVLTISLLLKNVHGRSLTHSIAIFALIFGVITSHYVSGLLLIGTLFLLVCYPYIKQVLGKAKQSNNFSSYTPSISISYFVFALIVGLIWYGFVSEIPFQYMVLTIENTILNFSDIGSAASRSPYALQLVGLTPRLGNPNIIGYWLGNIIRGIIVVGLFVFAFSKKSVRSYFRIKNEYFLLGAASVVGLVSSVALPYLTTVYNLDRLYYSLLIFMLPFLAIGLYFLASSIRQKIRLPKLKTVKIILAVLIVAQMVYSTGLLNQVMGVQSFVVLNKFDVATQYNELSPDSRYYISDVEAATIHWMAKNISPEHYGDIVADENGRLSMASQGSIPYDPSTTNIFLSNSLVGYNLSGKYFYLRYDNNMYNKSYAGVYLNITSNIVMLQSEDKICDNGNAQVVYIPK